MQIGTYINYGDRSTDRIKSVTFNPKLEAYDPNQLSYKQYQAWFYQHRDERSKILYSSPMLAPKSQGCLGDFEYQ